MDGIINVNKPQGMTSFRVVSILKRLSGEKRVGHAGTLDPMATGVLPVGLGKGTKVIQFLTGSTKVYRAQVELGITTDTYDITGNVTGRGDSSQISRKRLLEALDSFTGEIGQVPPMYSAVKHKGRPLYKLARSGIEVERKSRRAKIYRLELTDWHNPVATIEVECGKGTYIRSLAHDLGQLLGCGATLKSLVRLRCGCFSIEDAVTLQQLEDGFSCGYWRHFSHPIDIVLSHLVAVVVDEAVEEAIKNGRAVTLDRGDVEKPSSKRCRAYTQGGDFLAVMSFDPARGIWQPERVF